MKGSDILVAILLLIIAFLVADKLAWLPEVGGGQGTAVPQVIVVTAVPDAQLLPVNTAVAPGMATAVPYEQWLEMHATAVMPTAAAVPADLGIISPPATPTPLPTPAIAHSLQDIYLIYEDAAVCINAIQMNHSLTATCQTIRADLIRIAAEQGGQP